MTVKTKIKNTPTPVTHTHKSMNYDPWKFSKLRHLVTFNISLLYREFKQNSTTLNQLLFADSDNSISNCTCWQY